MNKPELMRLIADAMEKDPEGWWRGFDYKTKEETWLNHKSCEDFWDSFHDDLPIRPRPRTITINVEVPEPMREIPSYCDKYWSLDAFTERGVASFEWNDDADDHRMFARGIWPTEAEAQQAADAIFGALGRKV